VTRLEAVKESGRIFFTIGSMDYLRHGGRIGKLTGIVGSLLDIRPLITLREGEIFPSGVGPRGAKRRATRCASWPAAISPAARPTRRAS
jgi:fatty acid-binding protein DegV